MAARQKWEWPKNSKVGKRIVCVHLCFVHSKSMQSFGAHFVDDQNPPSMVVLAGIFGLKIFVKVIHALLYT